MTTAEATTGSSAANKRGRLAVAPHGQGPPADPVTAVLFNPMLLAKIRPVREEEVAAAQSDSHGGGSWRQILKAFRLVSKEARAAFDAACEAPLVFGPTPQDNDEWYMFRRKPEGPSPAQALDWALGMLRRGRRPRAVHSWLDADIDPDEWLKATLDLFRAIPQLSGRPGEGVARLRLSTAMFTPTMPQLIACAFPNLARLELTDDCREVYKVGEPRGILLSPEALAEATRGLVLLLGGASEEDGAGSSAGAAGGEGDGDGDGNCTAPLLPSLTELSLAGYTQLSSDLTASLRQATQLTALELRGLSLAGSDQEGPAAGGGLEPLAELASLTQISSLSLSSCAVPLLPVLTGALTRLTSLELTGQSGDLAAAVFAPLQGLKSLNIPSAYLVGPDLAGALSSLTRLSVGGFTLPSQELSQPLTGIPCWRLPAGLRELGLKDAPLEVLAGLEMHDGVRFDCKSINSNFTLTPGRHTATAVEEEGFAGTELLPAAEEALCGALRFLGRHLFYFCAELSVTYEAEEPDRLLQPVGGAEGTGPGRPNHGRWLQEVADLQPSYLTLKGIKLSYQDARFIVDHMENLSSLTFEPPCKLAILSLPLLAGLSVLEALHLDATPWAGDDPESSELRGQALASLVALARARTNDFWLVLNLHGEGLDADDWERVLQMGRQAVEEMRATAEGPIYPLTIKAGRLLVGEIPPTEPF